MPPSPNPIWESPTLPKSLRGYLEARAATLDQREEQGAVVITFPEGTANPPELSIGGYRDATVRLQRIRLPASGAPNSAVTEGSLCPSVSSASGLPVLLRWLPTDAWLIEWKVGANADRPTLARLAELNFTDGLEGIADVLKVLGASEIAFNALSLVVDPADDVVLLVHFAVEKLANPWALVPGKVELKELGVALDVHHPADPWRRRLTGSIRGKLTINRADIGFVLSNQPTLNNSVGRWLLTPAEDRLTLGDIFAWFADLGLGDPKSAVPEWASGLKDTLALESLAMELDPQVGAVSMLRGAVSYTPDAGANDAAVPGAKARFGLEKVRMGVAVEYPFGSGPREVTLDFSVRARVFSKRFELSGSARTGGRWHLRGECYEALSVVDAITELIGAPDDKAKGVLGDFELLLDRPQLTLSSGGSFSFDGAVLVQRKSGLPFDLPFGKLTVLPAVLRVRGDVLGTRYSLALAFALDTAGGPVFNEIALDLEFSSGRASSPVLVEARSSIRFPLAKRQVLEAPSEGPGADWFAPEPTDHLAVSLKGTYVGGQDGGFSFLGTIGAVALNPVIESLIGQDLPKTFPQLRSTGLELSFDTRTGAFGFRGGVTAGKVAFLLDIASDGKSKQTSIAGALVGDLDLGTFLKLFQLADRVEDGSVALTAAGFRYTSSKEEDQIDLVTTWGTTGRLSCALYRDKRKANARYEPMVVVYPGDTPWMTRGAVRWASAERKDINLFTPPTRDQVAQAKGAVGLLGGGAAETFRKGISLGATFNLKGTFVEKRLGLSDPIGLEIADKITLKLPSGDITLDTSGKDLSLQVDAQSSPTPPALPPAAASPAATPTATAAPADGEKTVRFETTLSPALILDKLSPSTEGADTAGTWRSYLGNCVVLSNIGLTLHTKPKPAVTVFADVAVNIGTWVSVAVNTVAVKLTPSSLSLEGIKRLTADFDVQGASLSIDIPPWIKGGAAVLKVPDEGGLQVLGVGELQLMKKVRIGALAFLRLKRGADAYSLDAGFGFVFATGLAIPLPPAPAVLTGIAGGFGYNVVPKLPTRAEDVPDNALLRLMRGSESDFSAKGMLDRLDGFRRSVEVQPGSWCVVVGLTLTLARMIDCALLAVVESRRTGLEVSVLGVADFTLGAKPGTGGTTLGRVQLALLARWSSAAGSVVVLGAITGESWLFDPKCRLQGGFALCFWYDGAHAGDFVVSLGGYSPLAPKRAHYPALDRVGLRWKVSDELSIYGESYLTLDRYGLQLGCAAGMSYRTAKVTLEAHYSFDAIVEWAPLYYEARLRISVHVEIRVAITLRLGLDVDVHLWGPPFGARIHVEVELWPFNPSFTVALGASYEDAQFERNNVPFSRVVELAAGAKDASTLKFVSGESPAVLVAGSAAVTPASRSHRFAAERPCAADATSVSLESAIPLTELCYGSKAERRHAAGGERGLQVRPKRWEKVTSSLVVMVYELIARRGAEAARREVPAPWELTPVRSQPLESLWVIPKDRDRPWEIERVELITAVQVTPPSTNTGARFDRVTLAKEMSRTDKYLRANALRGPAPAVAASASAVADALNEDRAIVQEALVRVGFAVGQCAKKGFRTLEATPMKVNGREWEVQT